MDIIKVLSTCYADKKWSMPNVGGYDALEWLDDSPKPTEAELMLALGSMQIKEQITALEAQQTPRRIREATLGTDGGWLANLEAQIVALRAHLK